MLRERVAMNESFVLSVCIPTYNRGKFLENLLNSILENFKDLINNIEICVSDNCSDDNTAEICERYGRKIPNFVYSRNSSNLGFSKNLIKVTDIATAEYVAFIGDDDYFDNDPKKLVLSLQKWRALESPPTIVLMNTTKSSLTLDEVNGLSLNAYIDKCGLFHASFIGNLIVKKTDFMTFFKKNPRFYLSAYPHLAFFFAEIKSPQKVMYLNYEFCKYTTEQRGWQSMQPYYTAFDVSEILYTSEALAMLSPLRRIKLIWIFIKSYLRIVYNKSMLSGNKFKMSSENNEFNCQSCLVFSRKCILIAWGCYKR